MYKRPDRNYHPLNNSSEEKKHNFHPGLGTKDNLNNHLSISSYPARYHVHRVINWYEKNTATFLQGNKRKIKIVL